LKGIDFAIRKAALELDIPEDQAKVVIMQYWQTIYKNLLSGVNSAITVRHLGTFGMSRYKLNKYIEKRIKKIRNVEKSLKLSDEKKEEIITFEKKRLSLALIHRNDIAWQYAENFGNV
jgi:hypothetical protein